MEKIFNDSLAYLIGLIAGKGYIEDNETISIEFPFTNEFIYGIAYCPDCGYLATKPSKPVDNIFLLCKNKECKKSISPNIHPNVKKKYNQPEEFHLSIKNSVIPFLKKGLNFEYSILSNSTCAFINLNINKEIYKLISDLFYPHKSFTSFEIPKKMWKIDDKKKIELVNGLLDSIGYANSGGWVPRNGKNGHGRMRVYFQIVNRNYALPVSIDNYLRDNFGLPIQTIDWGHPNIRDGNLKDYFAGKKSAFGREHQVKFYPEYYQKFKFRISSKQKLFLELTNHNVKSGFNSDEDWFPNSVKIIQEQNIKPNHPMETNTFLDKRVRTHVDAFWQINLKMGCSYLKKLKKESNDEKLFEITGDKNNYNKVSNKIEFYKNLSEQRFQALKHKNSFKIKTSKKSQLNIKGYYEYEDQTYPILVDWLKNYIEKKNNSASYAFDTSQSTIFNFFSNRTNEFQHFYKSFNNLDELSIRPDVVGFSKNLNDLYFIESKITSIGLKELGQILGYCLVAKPKEAFLITTRNLTDSLIKSISRNPKVLLFDKEKKIQFGKLKDNKVEIIVL